MAAADAVLVPLQCEFFALEGLTQLMKTIEMVRQSLNPTLEIQGLVLTMYDRRSTLSGPARKDPVPLVRSGGVHPRLCAGPCQ